MDSRERIVAAAARCIADCGIQHFSISETARRAGMSRPTVYAHFATREILLVEAISYASGQAATNILDAARKSALAEDIILSGVVTARRELLASGVLAPLARSDGNSWTLDQKLMSRHGIATVTQLLEPLLEDVPDLKDDLEEVAETIWRLLLTLVFFPGDTARTDEELREYLRRRLIPGLGLRRP